MLVREWMACPLAENSSFQLGIQICPVRLPPVVNMCPKTSFMQFGARCEMYKLNFEICYLSVILDRSSTGF